MTANKLWCATVRYTDGSIKWRATRPLAAFLTEGQARAIFHQAFHFCRQGEDWSLHAELCEVLPNDREPDVMCDRVPGNMSYKSDMVQGYEGFE